MMDEGNLIYPCCKYLTVKKEFLLIQKRLLKRKHDEEKTFFEIKENKISKMLAVLFSRLKNKGS